MLPKTGKRLPTSGGRFGRTGYAALIADVLQSELGHSHHAHKTLMKWTGANERTAKNWLSGSNGPSGEHLLQLVRNCDSVFECVLKLADRRALVSNRRLAELRDSLQSTSTLLSEIISDQEQALRH